MAADKTVCMKIFLSHASRDKPLVREIRKHLPEHIRSWIDEKQLLIGDDLESSIRDAIEKASDLVIIFLSRDSVRSEWVKRELAWALQREEGLGHPFVLPILFDKEAWDLLEPKEFRSRKYILCSDFSEAGVAHAAKMLNDELFAYLSRKLEDPAPQKSHVDLVDMPIQAQSEQLLTIGKGLLLLECSTIEPKLNMPYGTDFIGQDIFFPLIDLKLKNSGNDVAYLTKLEIDVVDVRVNPVPILEFYMSSGPASPRRPRLMRPLHWPGAPTPRNTAQWHSRADRQGWCDRTRAETEAACRYPKSEWAVGRVGRRDTAPHPPVPDGSAP